MTEGYTDGGKAVIEDGFIVIRVPVTALPVIVEGAWATNNLNPRYKITDADAFARDLVNELNSEAEDGTTRVHTMLDKAIEEAINQGAFGIEEHEQQEA
jgi:hypothetical protein